MVVRGFLFTKPALQKIYKLYKNFTADAVKRHGDTADAVFLFFSKISSSKKNFAIGAPPYVFIYVWRGASGVNWHQLGIVICWPQLEPEKNTYFIPRSIPKKV